MVTKLAKNVVFFVMAILHFSFMAIAGDIPDINISLARATYKLEGDGSIGTTFLLGVPFKNDPNYCFPVLITASHVLNNIKGNKAILYLRKKVGEAGEAYEKVPFELTIRKNGKNLWVNHKDADVAVMLIPSLELPIEIDRPTLLPLTWLANDGYLKDVGLRPGDELLCFGYPLGHEANDAGFPILRGGKIASYPIIPMKEVGSILLDFEIFSGNDGGPVYFFHESSPRSVDHEVKFYTYQFLVGLVSREKFAKIGEVIPSVFIKEVIDLLLSQEKLPVFIKESPELMMYKNYDDKCIYKEPDKNFSVNTPHAEIPLRGKNLP